MDKKRMILAGGLAVAAVVVFMGLNGMQAPPPPVLEPETKVIVKEVDYAQVLSVVESMQKGARVRADDFTWIDWPADAVTPALIVKDSEAEVDPVEQLEGSLVRVAVIPGEPLTMSKFIRAGEAGIMAALLKPGMRATTVRISVDTASGGFIQPGDRVDIVLKEVLPTISREEGGTGRPEVIASTIFEDVLVLAIDQSYTNAPEDGAALPGTTATLELSVADSERVLVAQDRGDLILLLRGFSGSATRGRSHASQPKIAVDQSPPLVVYRRGEVETVQLKKAR